MICLKKQFLFYKSLNKWCQVIVFFLAPQPCPCITHYTLLSTLSWTLCSRAIQFRKLVPDQFYFHNIWWWCSSPLVRDFLTCPNDWYQKQQPRTYGLACLTKHVKPLVNVLRKAVKLAGSIYQNKRKTRWLPKTP